MEVVDVVQRPAGPLHNPRVYIPWYSKVYQVEGALAPPPHSILNMVALNNIVRGSSRADNYIGACQVRRELFPGRSIGLVAPCYCLCALKLAVDHQRGAHPVVVEAAGNPFANLTGPDDQRAAVSQLGTQYLTGKHHRCIAH